MASFSVATSATVFLKDLRSEVRTRYALNALFMFVVTTLSIILFSIGYETVSLEILSGVFWIVIFFSAMSGLSRTFVSEEERGTTMMLQLHADPLSVFFGKLLFNLVLLFGLNAFSSILFIVFIPNFVIQNYTIFLITMVLGTAGLAATSTILAAIIAKANTKGTLYPVLSFPVLLPLLLSVISATKLAVEGAALNEALPDFQVLISYLVVIVTISYLLFEFIWKE
jgi:heme exporter protein B